MLVNPRLLFLYWVTDETVNGALAGAKGPAEIRVEASAEDGRFAEVARRDFDFRTGTWYLDNARLDCVMRARLGLREAGGFREILRTNDLRVPRERPGEGAEIWMNVNDLRAGRRRRARPPRLPAAAAVPAPVTTSPPGATAAAPRPADPISSPREPIYWKGPPQPGAPLRAAGPPGARPEAALDESAARAETDAGERGTVRQRRDVRGYLALVLHAHLPFVRHPERDYFLEEHWLFEGMTETYLPLLDALDHMAREGVPARITMSLTPTLMAMLRDPVLMGKYERHLERMCDLAGREVRRTRRDPDFSPVAGFYWDRLHRLRHLFVEAYRRDMVAQFARLESAGILEIIASAATHGLLPSLAASPGAVRAQVVLGVAEHRRQIGRAPRGIWLPECGYFEGLHEILAEAGIAYFFVDTHALRNAGSHARFDVHAPLLCPSGVAAFGRDEESSVQVWSSREGYPGDPSYRDFYRDIGYDLDHAYVAPFLDPAGSRGMTGFKYHRITGPTDHKEPYRREAALRTVVRQAADFVRNRSLQIDHAASAMGRKPIVVSMYDAELFGHWWFEGPEWIENILRMLPGAGIGSISAAQYLEEYPVAQVAEPSTSSWGERGYYDVWVDGTNDWILAPLHDAGRRMAALASRHRSTSGPLQRALAQAGRELLLAQASDWPFILKRATTVEYARRRVRQHLDRFDRLARQIEEGRPNEDEVRTIESRDDLFPDLDPHLWSAP